MKKVVLVIITLVLSLSSMACINPSMENGFEKLNQSLSELVASFDAVNIPQIQEDMEQITDDLNSIVVGIENYVSAVEEYNQAILIYNEALLEYNDAMLEYEDALIATDDFLSQIDSSIEGMLQALEGLREMKEEGNEWAGIFLQIAEIRIGLQDILATMKTKATKEQMEALRQFSTSDKYSDEMKMSDGGGLETETEEIEVLEFSFKEAFEMVLKGEIKDAKTIILLQYAKINKLCE